MLQLLGIYRTSAGKVSLIAVFETQEKIDRWIATHTFSGCRLVQEGDFIAAIVGRNVETGRPSLFRLLKIVPMHSDTIPNDSFPSFKEISYGERIL